MPRDDQLVFRGGIAGPFASRRALCNTPLFAVREWRDPVARTSRFAYLVPLRVSRSEIDSGYAIDNTRG